MIATLIYFKVSNKISSSTTRLLNFQESPPPPSPRFPTPPLPRLFQLAFLLDHSRVISVLFFDPNSVFQNDLHCFDKYLTNPFPFIESLDICTGQSHFALVLYSQIFSAKILSLREWPPSSLGANPSWSPPSDN